MESRVGIVNKQQTKDAPIIHHRGVLKLFRVMIKG